MLFKFGATSHCDMYDEVAIISAFSIAQPIGNGIDLPHG
jgi:hypothetical protein